MNTVPERENIHINLNIHQMSYLVFLVQWELENALDNPSGTRRAPLELKEIANTLGMDIEDDDEFSTIQFEDHYEKTVITVPPEPEGTMQ